VAQLHDIYDDDDDIFVGVRLIGSVEVKTLLLFIFHIVLIEWSLHTHSEHWQHFQSVFMTLAVGQIENLSWVQNGPVGFEEKKHYM
jgi:hypothetical protein